MICCVQPPDFQLEPFVGFESRTKVAARNPIELWIIEEVLNSWLRHLWSHKDCNFRYKRWCHLACFHLILFCKASSLMLLSFLSRKEFPLKWITFRVKLWFIYFIDFLAHGCTSEHNPNSQVELKLEWDPTPEIRAETCFKPLPVTWADLLKLVLNLCCVHYIYKIYDLDVA